MSVVPEEALRKHFDHVERVLAAKTQGEARAADAPAVEDDFPDDAPYDVRETGLIDDGDWPDSAGTLALRTLPDDVRDLGRVEHSAIGQEWLEFDSSREAEIVAAIRRAGYQIRRDDELVNTAHEVPEK
jgi:hypothetical protein